MAYDAYPRHRGRVQEVSYDEIEAIRDEEYRRFCSRFSRSPSRERLDDHARALVPTVIVVDGDSDNDGSRAARPRRAQRRIESRRRDNYIADRVDLYDDGDYRDASRSRDLQVDRVIYRTSDVSDRERAREIEPGRRVATIRTRRDGSDRDHNRSAAIDERDRSSRRCQMTREETDPRAEADDGDGGGILWYSGKRRCDANFIEKHFDSSYDGLIAGVAGAAIGSITAARFGGEKHRTLKAVGGALLGAAAFNTAENHYRVFTEVREEIHDKKEKVKDRVENAAERVIRG